MIVIFDTTKDVVLLVGLGAVWLQDGKPAKVRYASIKWKLLVLVYRY